MLNYFDQFQISAVVFFIVAFVNHQNVGGNIYKKIGYAFKQTSKIDSLPNAVL